MTFIAFHRRNNLSSVISISIHWSVEHSNCVVYKSIMDIMLFPAFFGTSEKMLHFSNMTGRNVINPNGYLSIPTRCLCVVNCINIFIYRNSLSFSLQPLKTSHVLSFIHFTLSLFACFLYKLSLFSYICLCHIFAFIIQYPHDLQYVSSVSSSRPIDQ